MLASGIHILTRSTILRYRTNCVWMDLSPEGNSTVGEPYCTVLQTSVGQQKLLGMHGNAKWHLTGTHTSRILPTLKLRLSMVMLVALLGSCQGLTPDGNW